MSDLDNPKPCECGHLASYHANSDEGWGRCGHSEARDRIRCACQRYRIAPRIRTAPLIVSWPMIAPDWGGADWGGAPTPPWNWNVPFETRSKP